MPRRKPLTISTPDAERRILVDALALANLPPAKLSDSKLLRRILRWLGMPTWSRLHARVSRAPSQAEIREQHRKLRSALHTIAQGGTLESEEVSIPLSNTRHEIHFDRAPELWVLFTVSGGELLQTSAPVVPMTLAAWVAYAIAIASSARWKDRHGISKIAECAYCEALYMKPRLPKGGRPPETCGRQNCIEARRAVTA
jgi:hypothetical protein